MSYPIRQQSTSVLCTLLLIVTPSFITGCSGGPATIAAGALSLSKSSAAPGEVITIYSEAIAQGATVQAFFRSSSGYEVVVELLNTQNGSAQVMVPPYLDPATGTFQAGTVSVSISGVAAEQSLKIGDLPDTGGIEPGGIYRAVLEVAIESYQFNLINIDTIDAELGYAVDASAANLAIDAQIAALQASLNELESTGQVTVDLGTGQTVVLGSDELRTADRILLAFFGQMRTGSSADKPLVTGRNINDCIHNECQNVKDMAPCNECLYQVIDGIRREAGMGTNWSSMLATGMGLTFFVGGWYFGAGALALTGLIVGVLGVTASFSNAAVNEQNTDAFLSNNGAGFNASQEAASQSIRLISGAASNLPGPPGAIATTTSVGLAVKDLVDGAVTEQCRAQDSRQRSASEVADFCSTVLGGGSSSDDGDDEVPDGNAPGGDDTPGGTFTVLNYLNIDGSMGSSASAANISLSGSSAAPVISWSVSNVFALYVTSGASILYGITGERMDSQGDTEQVPFAFSSVAYGDYGRSNTVPLDGTSAVAPALQSGVLYSITIGTLDGRSAVLNFKPGP